MTIADQADGFSAIVQVYRDWLMPTHFVKLPFSAPAHGRNQLNR